jgi:hypothetical protein
MALFKGRLFAGALLGAPTDSPPVVPPVPPAVSVGGGGGGSWFPVNLARAPAVEPDDVQDVRDIADLFAILRMLK